MPELRSNRRGSEEKQTQRTAGIGDLSALRRREMLHVRYGRRRGVPELRSRQRGLNLVECNGDTGDPQRAIQALPGRADPCYQWALMHGHIVDNPPHVVAHSQIRAPKKSTY